MTDKKTKKSQNSKTKKEVNTTRSRWRPPKNIIWEQKVTSRWRPSKNIIQPRKNKVKKQKELKKVINKTKDIFKSHKVWWEWKSQNNLALILLIFSFLLFVFSLYRAFYNQEVQKQNDTNYSNQQDNLDTNQKTIEEKTWNMQTWSIEIGNKETPNYLSWNIELADKNTITANTGISTNSSQQTWYKISNITFEKAFVFGEYSEEIKELQKFLINKKLYFWDIDWIYNDKLISSVYEFQKINNIIKSDTPKTVFGYLGPSTRNEINKQISEYQN